MQQTLFMPIKFTFSEWQANENMQSPRAGYQICQKKQKALPIPSLYFLHWYTAV